MATSSTLKTLKKEDGPISPREQPVSAHSSGLAGRLLTWRQSIWRRRWLSVATAWLICVAGWAIITLWPTSYNASAVVYANLAELVDEEAATEGREQTPVAMLKSMLLSEDNLDAVRKAVSLDPSKSQSLGDDIFLRSTVPPVFVLGYEHEDPDMAKQVLEAVIAGYRNHLDETSSASVEVEEDLDQQLEEQERRLQTAEAGLEDFKTTNAEYLEDIGDRAPELALLEEEIGSLEKQVKATIVDRDGIAGQLAQAREPETDATEVEPPRSAEELEAERKVLDAELSKLQERYADTHPYVAAVLDAIKTLDEEAQATPADDTVVAEEATIDRSELEQRHGELIVEVSALNSRLGNKRQQIELLQDLTKTTTSVEAELSGLEAEKEELKAALADLQQRRDELGKSLGGEAKQEAFRLIKQPNLPTDPIGPSRLMALAVVLFGGAGLGAIAAVVCNRYRGVFESAWQLRQRFDVGVLGTISEVLTPGERKRLGYSRLAFGLACLALVGAFGGLAIAELNDRLAPLGDHLRTRLLG
ncbi:MAG: hypothetical protein ACR2P3_11660 [Geminicoccaceae bacterium]